MSLPNCTLWNNCTENNGNSSGGTSTITNTTGSNLSPLEVVILAILASVLSVVTTGGNFMVLISFRIETQLQTVSNYFLMSLAVADVAIGIVSMPLFTTFLLLDNVWPFGEIMCDIWLSLDYTMSNASVANLLIISIDRYLSVTRPLTYRTKRTPKRAGLMIALAWIISIVMWTPWIVAWPHIEGGRTVPHDKCYIQFLVSNSLVTILTAIAAYFLPVTIITIIYLRIFRETKKRQRDLSTLLCKRRSTSKMSAEVARKTQCNQTPINAASQLTFRNCWTCLRRQTIEDNDLDFVKEKTLRTLSPLKMSTQFDKDGRQRTTPSLSASIEKDMDNMELDSPKNHGFFSNPSSSSPRVKSSKATILLPVVKKRENDQKAAKTLSAILLAFIFTWTPYNVFTVINALSPDTIGNTLYNIGYWLCYLNSTLNPLCYALCNEVFRRTFLRILTCRGRGLNASLRTGLLTTTSQFAGMARSKVLQREINHQ